jgi:hypothetical protein
MPRNKDLKQLVRARMKKTGEAYTTARAQILRKPKSKTRSANTAAPKKVAVRESVAPPVEYAALAGKSDETIKNRTGRSWEEWVRTLDNQQAFELPHGKIAALVNTEYDIDGWWAQTVTVGYERIKGLRARLQRMDGTYEASKSRTFDVPVATLFDAWANPKLRRRWFSEPDVNVRTATAPKSIRFGWNDGTIVVAGFLAKGTSKSTVAVQHTKLPDRTSVDRFKLYWSERLDALGELLAKK